MMITSYPDLDLLKSPTAGVETFANLYRHNLNGAIRGRIYFSYSVNCSSFGIFQLMYTLHRATGHSHLHLQGLLYRIIHIM